jgi:cold shock CspA family protein/ribosome-associated translation inhibitor RaiA
MAVPLEMVFRDIAPYEAAVSEDIKARAEKLDRFYAQILKCRVVVEAPHKHRRGGKLYQVSIDITVPGRKIIVDRGRRRRESHRDIFVAVGDAFDAAERQLEEHSQLARGDVKDHLEPRGRVSRLFPEEGYGFIEGLGGREIYFHRNSVLDGFEELQVGTEVRFAEEQGEEGPQASSVKLVRKSHLHHRRLGP